MPKCFKSICKHALCLFKVFFLSVAVLLIFRVSHLKLQGSAEPILSLTTRRLKRLTLRECDPLQSSAALLSCCSPVHLSLSSLLLFSVRCQLFVQKKISLTEILEMTLRIDDLSWMMFSFETSERQTVLH